MIVARTPSGPQSISVLRARDGVGVRDIAIARVRTASGLQEVFNSAAAAFDVAVSPSTVYGAAAVNIAVSVQTGNVTVTPSGAVAPYSYSWLQSGADPVVWTVTNLGGGVFNFTRPNVGAGESYDAAFTCTVTDARGIAVASPSITAIVANYGGYYGGF